MPTSATPQSKPASQRASVTSVAARSSASVPELKQHPLSRRHYRVATAAIEEMVDLVNRCLRHRIPGALVYARPRMGKTHAIDYLALHLGISHPDVVVLRMSCEHHRTDYEGSFFSTLLVAAGARHPHSGTVAQKRFELLSTLREKLQARGGFVVMLLCDEAQRLSHHRLEWLRDVHDQLSQHGFRLITFLVGQPQLMKQRAEYQNRGEEQIVARFMIEHLRFKGIDSVQAASTCLASYDLTQYPQDGGPTFTGYFYPQATACGFSLEGQSEHAWNAFVQAHAAAQLSGEVEIPMDYFTRAVEAILLEGPQWDRLGLELGPAHWARAVYESGYVAAQQTVQIPSLGV